ncbi:hypothetical protein KGA65_17080 [Ideonella sp. B7]|uniref:hypothetical protein n=1 Tax=Ideonella benzenivorans TaxID=2831643 RepID=UPI001CECDE2A|nr:hypothetical protein [Ideonella benzenivorans]MCA6218250.1 hypothetical protein [Ideonella benzenivorans]
MFRFIFGCFLSLFLFGQWPAVAQPLCLSADNNGDAKIRVKFVLPDEGGKGSYVRYEGGVADIPVVRVREVTLGKEVPAVVKSTYEEIINGKLNGHYFVISQGAAIGEVRYRRSGSRKVFVFSDDQGSYEGNRCSWEK